MSTPTCQRLVFRRTGAHGDVLALTPFTPTPPEAGEVLVRIVAAPHLWHTAGASRCTRP